MQGNCKIIGTIYLILGMIGSVVAAWEAESIILFLIIGFGVIVQVVTLYTLDEILEKVSGIKFDISQKKKQEVTSLNDNESGYNRNSFLNGGWKCPECGKMNASYVGTCGCGYNK